MVRYNLIDIPAFALTDHGESFLTSVINEWVNKGWKVKSISDPIVYFDIEGKQKDPKDRDNYFQRVIFYLEPVNV